MKSIFLSFMTLFFSILGLYGLFLLSNPEGTSYQSIPSENIVTTKEDSLDDIQMNDGPEITVLNTGKSDCIIITTGHEVVMIDTAEQKNYEQISEFLDENGIKKIDYMVITHFDKDHVGGAGDIISNYDVGHIFEPDYTRESSHVTRYQEAISKRNTSVTVLKENVSLALDGINLELQPTLLNLDSSDDNNFSIIVSAKTESNNYLFMGDAEELRLHEFIQSNTEQYDIIKWPHHGRWNMLLESFLTNTQPTFVIITCSTDEPAEEATLKLLERFGIEYWLTMDGSFAYAP